MTEQYILIDPDRYNFRDELEQKCFGGEMLGYLHNLHSSLGEVVTFENDNVTWWHNQIYDQLNSGNLDPFLDDYRRLVREVVEPLVQEPFCYQAKPTFRVQVPGNLSVGEFHRDSDYNHPPGEINFILPLTRAGVSNTVWTESESGRGDYHPLVMDPKYLIRFDGSTCRHGNQVSRETMTRVSIDFRVLPMRFYQEDWEKLSTGKQKRFVIGDYYATLV